MRGYGLMPSLVSATDTPRRPFIKAGTGIVIQVKLDSALVDAGNTGQTHIIRSGLCVAQYSAGDNITKWGLYATAGSDGLGTAKAFVLGNVNMKNSEGTAQDTAALVVIGGGCLIDETYAIGIDADARVDLAGKFLFSYDYEPS